MLATIRQNLAPPVFEGDEDKTIVARTLYFMALFGMVLIVGYVLVLPLVAPQLSYRLIIVVPLFVSMLVQLILVHRRQLRIASLATVSVAWVILAITTIVSGGVRSAGFGGFLVIVLGTAALLGREWALLVAALSLALGSGLVVAEENHVLPPVSTTPISALLLEVVYFLIAVGMLYFALDRLTRALRAAHAEIAERKLVEESLRESETKFRAIFENSRDAIGVSKEGRHVYVNPAYVRLFGCASSDEMVGRPITDLIAPDHHLQIQENIRRRAQGKDALTFYETRGRRTDGSEFDMEVQVTTYELHGEPYTLGLIRDITERKHAEESLRESEERFRRMFDYSRAVMLLIEPGSGAILDANPAADAFYGYSHETLCHMSIDDINMLPPEQVAIERQKVKEGQQDYFVFPHRLANGERRTVEVYSSPVDIGGRRLLFSIIHDITKRQQTEQALAESEARFRGLADQSLVGIGILELNRFLYVNPKHAEMFGYTQEEVLQLSPIDLTAESDRSRVSAAIRERISGEVPSYQYAFRGLRKDGSIFDVEVHGSHMEFSGRPVSISIILDITERKHAEEAIRKSELKFSKAFLASPGAISIATLDDGKYIDVNEGFLTQTGFQRDQVIGHTSSELNLWLDADERNRYINQLVSTGHLRDFETRCRMRAGEVRDLLVSSEIIEIENRECSLNFIYDITERKQRERELEAIAAMGAALRVANTRAEMLPVILDQLVDLLRVEGAILATRDTSSGEIVLEIGRGRWADFTGVYLPTNESITDRVIASGEPYVTTDLGNDPLFARPDLIQGLNHAACVPLTIREQTIGALWVGRENAIGKEEVRLLIAIADMAANAIHRETLHEQTEQHLNRMTALSAVDRAITTSLDLNIALNVLLNQTLTGLSVDAAAILLYSQATQTLEFATGIGLRTNLLGQAQFHLDDDYAGRAASDRQTIMIKNWREESPEVSRVKTRIFGFQAEGFVTLIAVPLVARGQVKGILEIFHRAMLAPDSAWLDFLRALAEQAAIAIDNANLFESFQQTNDALVQSYDATIEGWSRALDLRDHETEGHTQRVVEMTLALARAIELEDGELVHLRRGVLLHDIGKMGVPDRILRKPGPLNKTEWQIMRRHPEYAFEILSPIEYLRPAIDIPYCHHERWDGSGYPRQLKGPQIPLMARIFAVVDVWDALTSDRPYRSAWSRVRARQYIRAQAGKHFDPRVVEIFLETLPNLQLKAAATDLDEGRPRPSRHRKMSKK